MPKTQYFVAASIDGFIADANNRLDWLFQFNDAEGVMPHYEKFLANVGALAMGAATYEFILGEQLESGWPYQVPTWVFTHRELPTFRNASPNADIRFTQDDVASVHAEMREAAGNKNIWLVGGGKLVAQFVERGLLDELWLSVAPVVLGRGAEVLPTSLTEPLELLEVTRFGKGMVELRYRIPRET